MNGDSPCPNCGYAFDSHGLGGNCTGWKGPLKKKKGQK